MRLAKPPGRSAAFQAGETINHEPDLNRLPPRKSQATGGEADDNAEPSTRRHSLRPTIVAYLWANLRGDRYDVTFRGETIVRHSRDPEHDLARALLSRGHLGVTVNDGRTRAPRTIVNIEKAARLRVSEESRDGLRTRKWHQNPDSARYSPKAQPESPGPRLQVSRPSVRAMTGKPRFAPLPARAIADLRLDCLHFRALSAIALHDRLSGPRNVGQGCWASLGTLRECRSNYNNVSTAINELEQWGYVETQVNHRDRRRRIYRVIYIEADEPRLMAALVRP